jgi:hypothetical protein
VPLTLDCLEGRLTLELKNENFFKKALVNVAGKVSFSFCSSVLIFSMQIQRVCGTFLKQK